MDFQNNMETTEFDLEILSILKNDIENGKIIVQKNTDSYIEEMENYYPFGYNSIDWMKKDNVFYVDLKNLTNNKNETIDVFFKNIIHNSPNLIDEEIIIIGDGALNLGYKTNFKTFLKSYNTFFELPQDTYIWFSKSKKIINYTFEDELFFG